MKFMIKEFIIFTLFSEILLTIQKTLSPLSPCFKGRVGSYKGLEKGGLCGFEPHTNATGPYYIYPIAPNEDLFPSLDHCGVCYEMVGLSGVIRVRVEDYCKKDDKSGYCSGDMYHFNLPDIGLNYLIGSDEISHITFRMVDCGFSGNIRILMDEESDKFYLSFIVLDHNLAVSSVSIQENEMNYWERLNRDENNYWLYETGFEIEFPIKIKIYSIKGDYVTVNINKLNKERIYEADGNFKESNDTFFNITTLEKEEMPNNTRNCCDRDFSVFTPIYNNGEINEYYYINSQKVTFDDNTTEKYENNNTMRAKFQSKGKLSFISTYPIRADQFSGVSIVIKASKNCSDCISFNGYDLQKNINLNFNVANEWIKFRFDFESMEIKDNQFKGISLYYKANSQPFEIYIGNIDLIGRRIKPGAGVCLSIPFNGKEGAEEEGGNIPIHIPESDNIDNTDSTEYTDNSINTDNTTIQDDNSTSGKTNEPTNIQTDIITHINTTIINDSDIITDNFTQSDNITEIISEKAESNETSLTYVNILGIKQINFSMIYIKCENFTKIRNESMILLFESMNKPISFKTENCILDDNEEIISSFSCKLPENISNGEYKIQSPSDHKYFIKFSNNAFVNNREISFDIIIDTINNEIETQIETNEYHDTNSSNENNSTNNTEIKNSTKEDNEQIKHSPIIIIKGMNKTVKKGEDIYFQIKPVEQDKYYLENNEMVFTDITKTKFLFLKNCKERYKNNNKIEVIVCSVSNNIMKGIYMTLIKGNIISIQPGENIILQIDESIGGIVNESIDKIIDTNIISSQLKNFNLTFNIIYFNSSVSPYSLFPHKVYLSGKAINTRNLEENQYNYIINFTQCKTGNYSQEDATAIGSISCIFPDFVPAGTYSKLESDGLDVNPNSKINIVFKEDFNRSLNDFDDDKSSSSSSKTWIIWLVAGILLLILIILVIMACFSKKSTGKSSDNSNSNDESKGTENSNQNIHSSE